jgi:DNA-binding transcriptional MerR regulator
MDDFLHNLRSGNLKQPDRNRRQYGDPQYKGPQRRTSPERRKKDHDHGEILTAIKDLLKNLHESQKRMVKALDERNKTENRKIKALLQIAEHLDNISLKNKSNTASPHLQIPNKEKAPEKNSAIVPLKAKSPITINDAGTMICRLRDQGFSYAKIADTLEAEGIPTVSGKGHWRGQSVQRLYLKVQPQCSS